MSIVIPFTGRAGRYGSKFPVGEVTCLARQDLPLLHSSLKSPSPVLEVIPLVVLENIYLQGRLFPMLQYFLSLLLKSLYF